MSPHSALIKDVPTRLIATGSAVTLRLCEKTAVVSALILAVGCGSKEPPSSSSMTLSEPAKVVQEGDGWTLAMSNPTNPTPVLLSNGLIGLRLNRSMDASEENGRPLDAFRSDVFELDGEEKMKAVSNPMSLDIRIEGEKLKAGSKYRQSLDMKTGMLSTSWEQTAGGRSVKVSIQTVMHPLLRVIAQSVTVSTDQPAKAELAIWAPNIKQAADQHIEEFDCGDEVRGRISWRLTNDGGKSSWSTVQIGPHWSGETAKTLSFERVVSFGQSRIGTRILEKMMMVDVEVAAGVYNPPKFDSFSVVQKVAADYYQQQFWKTDIEIDGPAEDQQAVRSMLYYLRTGIHPESVMAPGPFGLTNQTYNGHVFWDADVWMFPALALIDPARAKSITDYRLRTAQSASRNFHAARSWAKDKPDPASIAKIDAVQFPWESSVSGLEVSPTETKQQHHITGTVMFGLDHAAALGLADSQAVSIIGVGASRFYNWRAPLKKDGEVWIARTLKDVVSPDESFWGNDDLYTNCIAEWNLKTYGLDKGLDVRTDFFRPYDSESFLNYTGDRLKGYKQAAGILAIYPLQDAKVEAQAEKMMDRFADKAIANGPAMTDSVNALVWARLGRTEKAYDAWRKSWKDFTNHPLMLFSEKRRKEETYFLTGAGGCLQSVVYGFLGFRIDLKQQPGAAWSVQLKDGRWLSVKPNLPKGWNKVTLKNFTVLGKRYTLIATHDAVRVMSGDN